VLAVLAITGCESNQERSAKLEKAAKQREGEAAQRRQLAQRALTITHESNKVKVTATAIVRGSEAAAAVITLRNVSGTALRDIPIQITVRDAQGASVYTNAIPGLSPTLLSAALLPAHGVITWIDDQVQATGTPVSVSAKIGEGTPVTGAIPKLSVEGAHLSETQAEGNLLNHSSVSQQELVIYGVARRGGKIVAAGRALLPVDSAGTSSPFQLFFVGNPSGAQLEITAPATTAG
jgi:hypothetical protein